MKLGERLLIEQGLAAHRSWTEIAFMVNAKYAGTYTPEELREVYERLPKLKDQLRRFTKM